MGTVIDVDAAVNDNNEGSYTKRLCYNRLTSVVLDETMGNDTEATPDSPCASQPSALHNITMKK